MKNYRGWVRLAWLFNLSFSVSVAFYGGAVSADVAPEYVVVALGNSITYHAPSMKYRWSGNWGMAASKPELDYLSVLSGLISSDIGSAVRVERRSFVELERHGEFDLHDIRSVVARANLLILELGDNVPEDENAQQVFIGSYRSLLRQLRSVKPSTSKIVCLGTWWSRIAVDALISTTCQGDDFIFVPLSDLGAEPRNRALNERPDLLPAVGAHPGDKGMSEIASRVMSTVGRF